MKQVTSVYGCAMQVTRGYPSLTVIQDLSERVPKGGRLVLLYLGDFDPSGEDIFRHISEEAEKKFPNVILEKVALKKEDIKKYGLPPIPAKRTDPRYEKFERKHGNRAVELDALPPETLLEKVKKAILRFTDAKAQARVHYETFIDSASSHLVDKALQYLRIQLSEATCACLQEELDEEAFVSGAKERLEKGLKPQFKVPDALRQRILKELERIMVGRKSGD